MPTIAENLRSIQVAVRGGEVRTAIHDRIEKCYSDVNTSTTNADSAAENANEKAALANDSALNANIKATLADTKASLANTAATNADTKASLANNAATAANTAATAANTAATNANNNASQAVIDCNTAIYNAGIASSNANRGASRADTAAQLIEGMTVSFENVGPNETGDVDIIETDGHKVLTFTLVQGPVGSPFLIKGDAYDTLADLQNGIPDPNIGDQYNVGLEAPYNIFRWTGTQWEDQGSVGVSVDEISNEEVTQICV